HKIGERNRPRNTRKEEKTRPEKRQTPEGGTGWSYSFGAGLLTPPHGRPKVSWPPRITYLRADKLQKAKPAGRSPLPSSFLVFRVFRGLNPLRVSWTQSPPRLADSIPSAFRGQLPLSGTTR